MLSAISLDVLRMQLTFTPTCARGESVVVPSCVARRRRECCSNTTTNWYARSEATTVATWSGGKMINQLHVHIKTEKV